MATIRDLARETGHATSTVHALLEELGEWHTKRTPFAPNGVDLLDDVRHSRARPARQDITRTSQRVTVYHTRITLHGRAKRPY